MFNIGFSELIVVGVIALIFIGPKQLPEVARTLGRFLNELRRASDDFKGSFTNDVGDNLHERLREARRDVHQTINEVRDQVNEPIPSKKPDDHA